MPTRLAKVVDPEELRPVPPSDGGELLVSADYSYLTGGYLENPAETKNTFVNLSEGKFATKS